MNGQIDPSTIARNIKALRLSNQLTQAEMAERLGYSERSIQRFEAEGTLDLNAVNMIALSFSVPAMSILLS